MPTMRESYERNVGDMDPDTMDTLFLDNATTRGKVFGLAAKYGNLAMLSMVNCNLTTLAGLPYMPQLSYLDVSNNQLGDEAALEHLVQRTPVVEKISMSGNMLGLAHLRPLRNLQKLSELDLTSNIHLGLNYRAQVFAMLPTLKVLDGCDIDGIEMDDDDEELEEDEDEYLEQPPHRRSQPTTHRAPPQVPPRGNARAAAVPTVSVEVRGGRVHQIVHHPRQALVAPHRALAAAQQTVRVGMMAHEHVYLHDDLHDEELLVEEEEVVIEGEDEEFVDVDGLEGDATIGSEGGGALGAFLDDTAFTYNEDAYYDPEDSISATIDDVIAGTSSTGNYHRHPNRPQNLPSTSTASTSSPRGNKRSAPSAPPTAIVAPKTSSSSGEEVDVEGLEPKAKRIADSIDAVARGGVGPSRRSDDDLNVE